MPAVTQATKEGIAERLAEARERTLLLVEPLSEEQLGLQLTEILSPPVWDLGHIANFEELWIVRRLGGRQPLAGELEHLYDAIENPRATRSELPILHGAECRRYMAAVRERALDVLDEVDLEGKDPLSRDGFAFELVIAHEHQHQETILQHLQMLDGYEPPWEPRRPDGRVRAGPEMVRVEGGPVQLGAGPEGFAYDNERPRHTVQLEPFWIDRLPVSNADIAQYLAEAGGPPPLYWEPDGEGGWVDTRWGRRAPLDPEAPVCHVDVAQAEAFARWAGKRLPTEAEWEAAALGADPAEANLDHLALGTVASAGESACGAVGMLGDTWEWTASELTAYPGFRAFPYREYSEVFFDDGYRVLRGGSWATRRGCIRPTFRNWDLPERRQIFAGLRCARDVA